MIKKISKQRAELYLRYQIEENPRAQKFADWVIEQTAHKQIDIQDSAYLLNLTLCEMRILLDSFLEKWELHHSRNFGIEFVSQLIANCKKKGIVTNQVQH